jgi:hypothetical protein
MRRGLRRPRRPGKRLDEAPPRGARASRRPSTGPIRSQHSVCDAVDPAKCPKRTVRHNAAENVQNLIAPELGGYGMNPTFTAAVAALIFAGGFAGSVAAGPFEDATAAYRKGPIVPTQLHKKVPSRRTADRPKNPRPDNDKPRRRIVVNERHPGVAISERSVTRSRAGGEINVRAGERSRETMSGSASKSPSQGSASGASRQSSSSQAGGETRAPGGAGRQPSTTGQANH